VKDGLSCSCDVLFVFLIAEWWECLSVFSVFVDFAKFLTLAIHGQNVYIGLVKLTLCVHLHVYIVNFYPVNSLIGIWSNAQYLFPLSL